MLALLRGVSRSFYLSIRLLPPGLRRPIAVGYLLARAADTVADTAELAAADRLATLRSLVELIEGNTQAQPRAAALAASFVTLQHDPQERALIAALPRCLAWLDHLDAPDQADVREVLRHITRGQIMDVERFGSATAAHPVALQNAAQLDEYTYRVAGSVGEFWTRLCFRHVPAFASLTESEMADVGRAYGKALQLVNILRDAGADLAAGRCYFPADELAAAGLAPADILAQPHRFMAVRGPWLARAHEGLAAGMRYADAVRSRRIRAASALPALLGARTLERLHASGAQGLAQRVKVPRAEVRSIVARIAVTFAARGPLQAMFRWDNAAP
jgi:farnesyl-diphosphate farnesyltransferase